MTELDIALDRMLDDLDWNATMERAESYPDEDGQTD